MRLKSIKSSLNQVKKQDPDTALTYGMIVKLIEKGELSSELRGNRKIIDFDELAPCLNSVFSVKYSVSMPRVRTINGALKELDATNPELGLGEDRLRALVSDGSIKSFSVGNRFYICMESIFEYIKSWRTIDHERRMSKARKREENINKQLAQVVNAKQQVIIKRK